MSDKTKNAIQNPGYDMLHWLYVEEQKSMREIGQIYGVEEYRVCQWMKYVGIPRRTLAVAGKLRHSWKEIDKKAVVDMYVNKNMTVGEISLALGVSDSGIRRLLINMDMYKY